MAVARLKSVESRLSGFAHASLRGGSHFRGRCAPAPPPSCEFITPFSMDGFPSPAIPTSIS